MRDKSSYIALFGGALRKSADDSWHSGGSDAYGATLDRLRIIAAYHLYRSQAKATIIALGGKGQYRGFKGVPNISAVLKDELMRLGVPASHILEEKKSNNTFEQLVGLQALIKNKTTATVYLLSNGWHLPRIRAFIKYESKLKNLNSRSRLSFESAERILLKINTTKWKAEIKKMQSGKSFKARILNERKGIRAIMNRTYTYR